MNAPEAVSVLSCTAHGDRALTQGSASPDERWLLQEARRRPRMADVATAASAQGWSAARLSQVIAALKARDWIALAPASSPMPTLPGLSSQGESDAADGARSLAALLSRHQSPSAPPPSSGSSPAPAPASTERPAIDHADRARVVVPLEKPAFEKAPTPASGEGASPESGAGSEELGGVSNWDPENNNEAGQPRKTFDESAVAVPEEGGDDLLRAMGVMGERPPPPPPPPPPVWQGNSGLDALMELLNAPDPEPAGVPAYGYGGQGRPPGPPSTAPDTSFPRLRDAPGSEEALPDADHPAGHSSARSDPQSGFPHSELARQKVRMQNQEDARVAARRKLNDFRQGRDRAQAEHEHVVNRQKEVEQHGQQTRTARGLGSRLAEIRARQEAERRGKP